MGILSFGAVETSLKTFGKVDCGARDLRTWRRALSFDQYCYMEHEWLERERFAGAKLSLAFLSDHKWPLSEPLLEKRGPVVEKREKKRFMVKMDVDRAARPRQAR